MSCRATLVSESENPESFYHVQGTKLLTFEIGTFSEVKFKYFDYVLPLATLVLQGSYCILVAGFFIRFER